MVKIVPQFGEDDDGCEYETITPHYNWLRSNNIKRYRCSGFPMDPNQYKGHVSFRFESAEDAMAFKLQWT